MWPGCKARSPYAILMFDNKNQSQYMIMTEYDAKWGYSIWDQILSMKNDIFTIHLKISTYPPGGWGGVLRIYAYKLMFQLFLSI